MLDDKLVIDGVAHAYDVSIGNRTPGMNPDAYRRMALHMTLRGHQALESTTPPFPLSPEEFTARWEPEELAHAFFVESDVDIAVHHAVRIDAYFKGASMWEAGLGLRDIAPDRVLLYGYVDTFNPDRDETFEDMARQVEQGAKGFKFYPSSGFFDENRRLISAKYDDPDDAFPYFEKARSLGIRNLAFHKAQPVGPGSIESLQVNDLTVAAAAFPDLKFEVVHDGWHFLDECSMQLKGSHNIYANLEGTMNLIVRQPMRFAHILGRFMLYAGSKRILYASGCALAHPEPILQAFKDFEMPRELREGFGYPEVTEDDKANILGLNFARLHDIDVPEVKRRIANDKWSQLRAKGKPAPWTKRRAQLARPDYPHERFTKEDFTAEDWSYYDL